MTRAPPPVGAALARCKRIGPPRVATSRPVMSTEARRVTARRDRAGGDPQLSPGRRAAQRASGTRSVPTQAMLESHREEVERRSSRPSQPVGRPKLRRHRGISYTTQRLSCGTRRLDVLPSQASRQRVIAQRPAVRQGRRPSGRPPGARASRRGSPRGTGAGADDGPGEPEPPALARPVGCLVPAVDESSLSLSSHSPLGEPS